MSGIAEPSLPRRTIGSIASAERSWIAYHLFYHEDLNQAVLGFVRPVVADLLAGGRIDRFFFVRFGLGGPHIRLRLRVIDGAGAESEIDHTVRLRAEQFIAQTPSRKPLAEEAIQRGDAAILAGDPNEKAGPIHPDNTLVQAPFVPEVERYGGPRLLPCSLDCFFASSLAALDFVCRHHARPRANQLGLAYRLLLRQALHFALDPGELSTLLRYGVDSWGKQLPAIVAKGERLFASKPEMFCELFTQELDAMVFPDAAGEPRRLDHRLDPPTLLALAARQLSATIGQDDRDARATIGTSQLHMTATRIGLLNVEEAYLGSLLSTTAAEIGAARPATRSLLAGALARGAQAAEAGPWFSLDRLERDQVVGLLPGPA